MDIAEFDFMNSDFHKALDYYPNVDYRYFVIPPMDLDGDSFMDFNHTKIIEM